MNSKLIFIIGLFLIIFSGCSTNYEDSTSQIKSEVVEVVITKVGYNPIFYPLENSKVEMPEGLEVKLKSAGYSQAELYTLSSNSNLIGILSNINIGKAYLEGEKYKIIAPYYREIVGPENFSMGQLVSLKESEIMSAKDLEGKKVGIQGATDGSTIAMMTAMKNKYHVNLDSIEFIAVESQMAPQLVKSGELDAAMFDSDYLIADDFNQNFKTIQDFGKDLFELYGVVPPAKFFVVKKETYEKDPQLFKDAVEFIRKNYQWSKENIEEISRLEADATGEDYNTLVWKSDYESRLDKLTQKDLVAYQAFYETAKDRGVISKIPDINDLFVIEN